MASRQAAPAAATAAASALIEVRMVLLGSWVVRPPTEPRSSWHRMSTEADTAAFTGLFSTFG
ncbi:hypothetical protein BJP25_11665 [Actinokineospora bangkokensis]|uniref:Uncharacterized protein n=1 Tax=Actinokineospora bangkokensis TaxID=1193682 RepID=A0A1Q9LQZ3_9PSEU|nr:hypothetical protein BJP25_11665 [Actinokineospora bangkokensis]